MVIITIQIVKYPLPITKTTLHTLKIIRGNNKHIHPIVLYSDTRRKLWIFLLMYLVKILAKGGKGSLKQTPY